jgi:hypothetical protein
MPNLVSQRGDEIVVELEGSQLLQAVDPLRELNQPAHQEVTHSVIEGTVSRAELGFRDDMYN